ncbi:MAG: polysaccharide deacetylase family protein [Candidatus Levybacteria bacterium]|nr:polysaccharide deacetylase family protein [Candidatus Levybacteria bacterium]
MTREKIRFDSSWDDAHPFDEELADLLKKFNLPGTFYLPGNVGPEYPINASLVKKLVDQGFEIGGHTVSHPQDLKQLSVEQILKEISDNKQALETLSGQKVTKFCYPRGRYDDRVIRILKGLGFTYARTTEVLRLTRENAFRTPTSIHVYQRKEYGDHDWVEMANSMVELATRSMGGVFHIWGHSWELTKFNNWEKLESFFAWLTENYEIVPV